MTEIKLTKRYPHSREEDITDAFMRGYKKGKADRPQGEWIDTTSGEHWKCSLCGCRASFFYYDYRKAVEWLSDYCPNCGAHMKGADDE